jgi:hypothetical protein
MKRYAGILLCISLLFTAHCAVTAQTKTDTTENYIFGYFLTMPVDIPFIDNTGLNEALVKNGFPAAKHYRANTGIGLQFYADRGIVSLSWNKSTKSTSSDLYRTDVEYSAFSFSAGYNILPQKSMWFSLYPYIGFKGYNYNYLYREQVSAEKPFDDYFQTNLGYREITHSRAHLDLGVGFSHHWFYLINFRAGYLIPLEKSRWKINSNEITLSNAPNLTYNYYITLTVGFGTIADSKSLNAHFGRLNERLLPP